MSPKRIFLTGADLIGIGPATLNALAGERIFPLYGLPDEIILRPGRARECVIHFRRNLEKELVMLLPEDMKNHLERAGNSAPAPFKTSFDTLDRFFTPMESELAWSYAHPYALLEITMPLPALPRDCEVRYSAGYMRMAIPSAQEAKEMALTVFLTHLATPFNSLDREYLRTLERIGLVPDLTLLTGTLPPRDKKAAARPQEPGEISDNPLPGTELLCFDPHLALDAIRSNNLDNLKYSGLMAVKKALSDMPKGKQAASAKPAGAHSAGYPGKSAAPQPGNAPKKQAPGGAPSQKTATENKAAQQAPFSVDTVTMSNLAQIRGYYEGPFKKELDSLRSQLAVIKEKAEKTRNDYCVKGPADNCAAYGKKVQAAAYEWMRSYNLKHRSPLMLTLAGGAKVFGREASDLFATREKELDADLQKMVLQPNMAKSAALANQMIDDFAGMAARIEKLGRMMPDAQLQLTGKVSSAETGITEYLQNKLRAGVLIFRSLAKEQLAQASGIVAYSQKNTQTHAPVLDAIKKAIPDAVQAGADQMASELAGLASSALKDKLTELTVALIRDLDVLDSAASKAVAQIKGTEELLSGLRKTVR